MKLTRKVSFSSGHRYWLDDLTEQQNRALFGKWASPHYHGHNYELWATIAGQIDPKSGMVINIKVLDGILKERIVSKFDQKSINDEVPFFRNAAPSLENLVKFCADALAQLPEGVRLTHLRLQETPRLWAERNLEGDNAMTTLTRTYEFCASHRLHNPELSDEQNAALFGKCSNPNGHGHNYILEVTVTGDVNPTSGMMVDLGRMDAVVNELVVDYLDHKHLNLDIEEFKQKIPTSEEVTRFVFERLNDRLPAKLVRVRLHETGRNSFEYAVE